MPGRFGGWETAAPLRPTRAQDLTVLRRGGQAGPMSLETTVPAKKIPVMKLVIAAVVLGVIGLFVLREVGLTRMVAWLDQFIALIRAGAGGLFYGDGAAAGGGRAVVGV